jgi:hypothetical protein
VYEASRDMSVIFQVTFAPNPAREPSEEPVSTVPETPTVTSSPTAVKIVPVSVTGP